MTTILATQNTLIMSWGGVLWNLAFFDGRKADIRCLKIDTSDTIRALSYVIVVAGIIQYNATIEWYYPLDGQMLTVPQ